MKLYAHSHKFLLLFISVMLLAPISLRARHNGPEDWSRLDGINSENNEWKMTERHYCVEDSVKGKIVETLPQYPGGEAALFKHIADNLRYPALARENGIQGRVIVQFTIRKDGTVGDVKVVRGVDDSLDAEAIRVVKTLKRFTPATQNGQPVNVRYTCPITFRLD